MDGLDISNARKEDGVDGLERLPQGEINLDVQRHVDGYAVLHSRTEFPLLQRSNSVLIQSQTQASHNLQDLNRAILADDSRSEEHTSELQSLRHLVCRLLLEKKKYQQLRIHSE